MVVFRREIHDRPHVLSSKANRPAASMPSGNDRRAANPGFHIFSAPERAKLSGQLEPFIDEAMEYLDQEYVRAMNKDLPLVTMTFPTIRLTARATPAASASFGEETE